MGRRSPLQAGGLLVTSHGVTVDRVLEALDEPFEMRDPALQEVETPPEHLIGRA